MKISSFVVFFCLVMGIAAAQETEQLTIDQCINIALENNYQLRVADFNVELAQKDIVTARSAWLPHLNSSFQFGKYIQGKRLVKQDVPVDFDPVTGDVLYQERNVFYDQTERNTYSASLSLNQHIYDFGRTGNNIRFYKAYQQFYEHSLFNQRHLVIANVSDKYYQLLKSKKLFEVYEEAVHHAEENLDYNETMLDVGLKSQAEIYQARVNLGTQRTQLINQENNIELAKAALNNAMGRSPETPVEIAEDLPGPIYPDYDFSKAVEIALEKNERLKAVEQELRASEYAIRAAKARYAPRINASVSYNRNNDDLNRVYSTTLDEDYTATLGAGIDFNIFNGLADKAEIERQKLQYELTLEKLKEEKRILLTDIREYFLLLQSFQNIININRENIDAYQENLRLQQEKRRVGSGTELEVMQAQLDVVQAQETLVRAEYDAKIARAYLEAALGIIDNGEN